MVAQISRSANLILSAIFLIISLPLLLLISVAIFLETGDNPLFVQERGLTLETESIKIYKLRTLKRKVTGLSASKSILVKEDLENQVTFIGKILRKTGIDELPQLINVLKGEMVLIGPRPLSKADLYLIKLREPELYERRNRLQSKPGISGFWQVFGDKILGVENLVSLDERYEASKSFHFDLFLIFSTVFVLASGKHSDSILTSVKKEKLNSVVDFPILRNLFPLIILFKLLSFYFSASILIS